MLSLVCGLLLALPSTLPRVQPSMPLTQLVQATRFRDAGSGLSLSLPANWQRREPMAGLLAFSGPENASLEVSQVDQEEYMFSQRASAPEASFFAQLGQYPFHIFPYADARDQGLMAYTHPDSRLFKLTFHGPSLSSDLIWDILATVQFSEAPDKRYVFRRGSSRPG